MKIIKSICVFAGSELGYNRAYENAAINLGDEISRRGLHLVYGGGKNGLMGVLADTVLSRGGMVTGVITESLDAMEGHKGLMIMHKVTTMQERRMLMAKLADGFVTMPGGLGTLEEFFEVWNSAKLKLHDKPICLLNVDDYYSDLIELTQRTVTEGFSTYNYQSLVQIFDNEVKLLDSLVSKASIAL